MLNGIISMRGCIISFIFLKQLMFNQFLGHFNCLIHYNVWTSRFNEASINVNNNDTYIQTNKTIHMNKQNNIHEQTNTTTHIKSNKQIIRGTYETSNGINGDVCSVSSVLNGY